MFHVLILNLKTVMLQVIAPCAGTGFDWLIHQASWSLYFLPTSSPRLALILQIQLAIL